MDGEPFPNGADSELSLSDGLGDELMRGRGLDPKVVTVEAKKRVRDREARPFVSIDERMIVDERFHQSGRFVHQVIIVPALWTENRRLQQTGIANPVNSAEFLDELPMHLDCFGNCNVKEPRHLFGEKFVEFLILIRRPPEVPHNLRPHRSL